MGDDRSCGIDATSRSSARGRLDLAATNAVALGCPWTVAFHSTVALKSGVSADDVAAIRIGRAPADRKLAALSRLAKVLIARQGRAVDAEVDELVAAGYSSTHVLEVIAAIAISTMAGLTASMANTPVEDLFEPQTWQRPEHGAIPPTRGSQRRRRFGLPGLRQGLGSA